MSLVNVGLVLTVPKYLPKIIVPRKPAIWESKNIDLWNPRACSQFYCLLCLLVAFSRRKPTCSTLVVIQNHMFAKTALLAAVCDSRNVNIAVKFGAMTCLTLHLPCFCRSLFRVAAPSLLMLLLEQFIVGYLTDATEWLRYKVCHTFTFHLQWKAHLHSLPCTATWPGT